MENKEEILKAIDWCITEYEKSLNMDYFEVCSRDMQNGVCYKISKIDELSQLDIDLIINTGHQYVKENKTHLKKLFPLMFKKGEYKMKSYWCNMSPCIALAKEEVSQSLAIRFYILNEIRQIIQFL